MRGFAAAAFSLQTTVMARTKTTATRITNEVNEEVGWMYYMNDGVYGSFNCLIYDHAVVEAHQLFPKSATEPLRWSALWGPTCDGLDLVVPKCRLPLLQDGDWLTFDNMGAYTLAAGCEFNGFPRPLINYFVRAKDV